MHASVQKERATAEAIRLATELWAKTVSVASFTTPWLCGAVPFLTCCAVCSTRPHNRGASPAGALLPLFKRAAVPASRPGGMLHDLSLQGDMPENSKGRSMSSSDLRTPLLDGYYLLYGVASLFRGSAPRGQQRGCLAWPRLA